MERVLPAGSPRALHGFLVLWPKQHPEWALKATQTQGLSSPLGPAYFPVMAKGCLHAPQFFSILFKEQRRGQIGTGEDTRPVRREVWVLLLVLPLTEFWTLGSSRK